MIFQENINELLTPLSDSTGTPVDQLRVVIFLFLSFPLAIFFKQIKGEFNRHVTSLITGILFVYYTCGSMAVVHVLIASSIGYAMMKVLPRERMGYFMFVFMFTYMSSYHIYRIWVNYLGWDMDASGPLMVLTIKLTMLACNFSDGARKKEELFPYWNKHLVAEVPSPLAYYSYVFFWITSVTGPGFHFSNYTPYINESLFRGKQYSTWIPFLKSFGEAILYLVIFFASSMFLPFEWMMSDEFTDCSMIYKYGYVYISLLGLRFRYYFTWKMAEAAGNLAGFGLRIDENGEEHWDRLKNVDVWKIEGAGSLRDVTTYWNIKTAEWLKHYCYFRQAKPGERVPGYANYLTNMLSAFWHGFYPGYYLSFVLAALTVDLMRKFRRIFRPLVTVKDEEGKEVGTIQPQKMVYDFFAHFFCRLYFNYGMISFLALSLERAITIYSKFYFIPHIMVLFGFALTAFLPKLLHKKKKQE